MMAKKTKLPIESLQNALVKRFPDAQISLDKPRKASGVWFLDVASDGHPVHVQWQDGKPFGISSSQEQSYGDGADEIYEDEEAAYGRIVSLLLSHSFTSPPRAVSLKELRKENGLSQAELAEIMNKQQGEVSKIERRRDVLVSTLADYARAVRGELQIIVRMNDGSSRRLQLEETVETSSHPKGLANQRG
jgi:DNA-binding transcriptional regulator YiaG